MFKLIKKIRSPLLLAVATIILLSPALAAASGESYFWQDSSRQAVVANGGAYGSTEAILTGPAPSFSGAAAANCSDGSGQGDVTLKVGAADYKANVNPIAGTVTTSCATGADASVKIYADQTAAKAAATAGTDPGPSCKGGVLSWVICPVYDFILNSIKTEENNVIAPLLQLTPLSTSSNSPPYQIWSQFRNLANIGFIIAFLVIIFAHTLSIGIDSYSLKKTLPRLVYAAIFVQFSFILVAAGIDLANILGAGVQGLVLSPLRGNSTLVVNNVNGTVSLVGLAVGISAALTAVGGVLTGTLLLVLFGAFFAILGVILTLVARQILVIFLLVVAPLAFVAWVLPNTESLFKLWRTSLIRLLLMYPMIMLLFASGKLFGAAAIESSHSGFSGGVTNTFLPLISVIAYIIPLYFIPFTFKYAGAAMNTMSGWIHGASMGGYKKIESTEGYKRLQARTQQRRAELASGQKLKGFGAITGNPVATMLGRGTFNRALTPNQHRANNVRAMVNFNKHANDWKKRLEEENMTYEGFTYLSLGDKWYSKTRNDAIVARDHARLIGDHAEASVQQTAIEKLDYGRSEARRYMGSAEARAAAALLRAGYDLAGPDDRESLLQYTGNNEASRYVQRQMWDRIKEGSRKVNVHLAYTDINGNLNAEELRKNVSKKNTGDWVNYSKDAIEAMHKSKVLDALANEQSTRRTLINIMGTQGGPSIGAEQQNIIREVLERIPAPDPTHPDPSDL